MRKINLMILIAFNIITLTACGNEKTDIEEEIYYSNYELYDHNTHLDSYESINNQTAELPNIIIDDSITNWVEPEDNGVEALTYFEIIKQDLDDSVKIHNSDNYTEVALIENGYAVAAINVLGEFYENAYASSAIYEAAIEAKAEYIDMLEFKDMGDGTFTMALDFGTDIVTLFFTESEAFID